MITSPNISDYHSSQSPVLVGVIVDVSSSMRRNWRNRNGKQLPRIEVIRDTLNKWIREEQQLRKIQADNIKIFCLGMGFTHGMRNEINSSKEARKRPPTKVRCKKAEANAID